MITVITPFQRKENLSLLLGVLEGKCDWTVLIDDPDLKSIFPEWVNVVLMGKPREGVCKPNMLINRFFANEDDDGGRLGKPIGDDTQYMVLCDDDSVEDGFFEKIPNADVVCVSMKRGYDTLVAAPENMRIARVGGEQVIMKGRMWKRFRYGLSNVGDGEMIEKVVQEHEMTYVPDAYVLFNHFQGRPYSDFRRRPLVMFVGDYFCAGNPGMGISEWEGNIAKSLDSTGLADVACFHMDKYCYHTGQRGDSALIERVDELRPDYVVLIIYKPMGSDRATPLESTLRVIKMLGVPIITIWGDLEAKQQRDIAETLKPYIWKGIGTANRGAVESVGFSYSHVPKDPRVWNDPGLDRDIDVVFSGSYGLGREERQFYLRHLIDNGVGLVCGGSEGRDHFSTEEYAGRYKRARISLSFSRAHGMNVVNARPFEAMSCGSMLLEQESAELAGMYTPYVDYVPWKDEVDLLEKVRYYLEHDDERRTIAESGRRKTEELYSARSFWRQAISDLNNKNADGNNKLP